jgi:hypothetical protein
MNTPLQLKMISLSQKPDGRDPRFRRAVKFFALKGYVMTSLIPRISYRGKLSVGDLIWACENVEPRLFEILPAALICFAGHFDAQEIWPQDLCKVVQALKAGSQDGPDFRKHSYRAIQLWLDFETQDQRSKRIENRRTCM